MVKKTLLSLAIAATAAGLAGCNVSTTDKYDDKIVNTPPASIEIPAENGVAPVFDPANSLVPLGIDFLYANTTDGTVNTADKTPPVTTAMNQLAGFSTVAPIYLNMKGALNPASLTEDSSVFLLKIKNTHDGKALDAVDLTKTLLAVGALTPTADGGVAPVPAKFADAFAATQPVAADYSVDQVILTNGGSPVPTIRITLNKPLEPRTKYMVVVTNKVEDASSNKIVPPAIYDLARGDDVLPSAALNGVRSLVKLWDGMAKTKLAMSGKLNLAGGEDVVLSYTFTTDDALNTLVSYAAPEIFFKNNLELEAAENLADKAAGQPEGTKIAARAAALKTLNSDPAYEPADPQEYFSSQVEGILETVRASSTYQNGLYSQLAQADLKDLFDLPASMSLRDIAVAPAPREVKVVPVAVTNQVLAAANSADPTKPANTSPAALGVGSSTSARFVQGYIELPNFLGAATKTTLSSDPEQLQSNVTAALRQDSRWQASDAVGNVLSKVKVGQSFPPLDNDGVSTNVTYRFPFPKQLGTQKVPLLVSLPTDGNCTAPYPVIMYVHGITGSRANMVPFSGFMADDGNCIASVAIDLPEHGIAPQATDSTTGQLVANSAMPFNMEVSAGLWPTVIAGYNAQVPDAQKLTGFDDVTERHNGVYGALARQSIDYANVKGDSGSTFINLQNFGRTRDNLRQAVVDLLQVNASLGNLDEALGGDGSGTVLDLTDVNVVGHSLGGMVASAFVAVNNQAAVFNTNLKPIQHLTLANTGAHLTKLLENSPAFAPTILGGLAASGVDQGSISFESFLSVFQASVDAVDPANSLSKITTPVLSFVAVGDNTVPNYSYFGSASNPFAAAVSTTCFATPASDACTADKNAGKVIALPNVWIATAQAPLAGSAGLSVVNPDITTQQNTGVTHSAFAKPETAEQATIVGQWTAVKTAVSQ